MGSLLVHLPEEAVAPDEINLEVLEKISDKLSQAHGLRQDALKEVVPRISTKLFEAIEAAIDNLKDDELTAAVSKLWQVVPIPVLLSHQLTRATTTSTTTHPPPTHHPPPPTTTTTHCVAR